MHVIPPKTSPFEPIGACLRFGTRKKESLQPMAKATKKEAAPKDKAAAPKKDNKKKGPEQAPALQRFQQFVKDSWGEFRKIQWPTPRQATNESIVVLITVVFMIALVNFYDLISNFILSFILQK